MLERPNDMEQILEFLKTKMAVEETSGTTTLTKVIGEINPPIENTIKEIKDFFSQTEYTPIFNEENNRHIVQFGIFLKRKEKPRVWLNIILFFATILTTLFAGALNSGARFEHWTNIFLGIPFSFSIMAILTAHELGHYFTSKKQGMITTLPYFIPVPFHFIGTFGAIIRMKSIVPSRRALLKVGMAGPITGFLVALPITIIGLALSELKMAPEGAGYLKLGDSLLFYILAKIIHPAVTEGTDIFLHPMAFAGWLGFLVTSMNLIPIGQLDGGHVVFSLLLKKRNFLYIPIIVGFVAVGILWPGWVIWGLLAFFIARQDPVIQDSLTPLSKREKFYALIPLIVLILTFIPRPFAM